MIIQTKYPEVFIDINESQLSYKIIQIIDGKNKVRRRVVGRLRNKSEKGKPKCDNFGNRLYNRFNDFEDAKQHALNFVNNHLNLKPKSTSNYDFQKPSQAQELGDEWDHYAWSEKDY
jgi:hypothetical protein